MGRREASGEKREMGRRIDGRKIAKGGMASNSGQETKTGVDTKENYTDL